MKIEKHSTSNVIACLGGDQIILETRPINMPTEGEILLQLRVVGFCGTDMFKLTTGKVDKGIVLGHEIVGEVVKIGKNVKIAGKSGVIKNIPDGKTIQGPLAFDIKDFQKAYVCFKKLPKIINQLKK